MRVASLAPPGGSTEAESPVLSGYILDYDGPFDGSGSNATHVACLRHGKDFLRDREHAAAFERGFAELARRRLSFDLQCCPAQLPSAAAIFARNPDVRVSICHMGKPRHLAADGGAADAAKLEEWREGLRLMAALPQVHLKLSMLGYAVPGWHADASKEALLRSLVRESIALFGARRCMFNSNWYVRSSHGSLAAGSLVGGSLVAALEPASPNSSSRSSS